MQLTADVWQVHSLHEAGQRNMTSMLCNLIRFCLFKSAGVSDVIAAHCCLLVEAELCSLYVEEVGLQCMAYSGMLLLNMAARL